MVQCQKLRNALTGKKRLVLTEVRVEVRLAHQRLAQIICCLIFHTSPPSALLFYDNRLYLLYNKLCFDTICPLHSVRNFEE